MKQPAVLLLHYDNIKSENWYESRILVITILINTIKIKLNQRWFKLFEFNIKPIFSEWISIKISSIFKPMIKLFKFYCKAQIKAYSKIITKKYLTMPKKEQNLIYCFELNLFAINCS